MSKKTPQEFTVEYQTDSAMMRAGFVKAMLLIARVDNVPEDIKQVALECIDIISGLQDYKKKTIEVEDIPKPVQPKTEVKEPEVIEEPKQPKTEKPVNPQSPNYRFRKRR